jgi:hypothetical protein
LKYLLYFHKELNLPPSLKRRLAESGQEIQDVSGYFLFEKRGCGDAVEIDILAQALSDEAAFRLRELFQMA